MTEKEITIIEQTCSESVIQHTCVCWFRKTFPKVANLLFAVPNGGWRGPKAALTMRYEGQVNGVADLILLFPAGGKSSLCLEMKVPKKNGSSAGTQSKDQKAWQELVEANGSIYVVCHGLIEFINAVCSYLHTNAEKYISEALNKYPLYR